jgi:hypothetical protein
LRKALLRRQSGGRAFTSYAPPLAYRKAKSMVIRKITMPGPDGKPVVVSDIPVAESHEKWSEFTLEDGTIIKAKLNVVSFFRIDGQYDNENNPLYGIKAIPAHAIVSVPDNLKRRVQ